MITALIGDNSFAIHQALAALISASDSSPERFDGSELEQRQLPDLLMGATLFASHRLVIIRNLSQNTALWAKLPDWLERVADTTHLVLIDEKPDKRTSAYKALKSGGAIKEFPAWTDKDRSAAEQWVAEHAKQAGVLLDRKLAQHLVQRVGVDQWQLASAIEQLSLVELVSVATIDEYIEPNPAENVFQLLELSLQGRHDKVYEMLQTLELTEEPYRLFALLSSQVVQLAAVGLAGSDDRPAKDFAIHPYVAGKLAQQARRLGPKGIKRALGVFAKADADLKISRGEPWLVIQKSLASL
jgi:DNA polymerase III delta subunit